MRDVPTACLPFLHTCFKDLSSCVLARGVGCGAGGPSDPALSTV